jgi:Cu(I)/Ag(I) efflux system membrane fusion protein
LIACSPQKQEVATTEIDPAAKQQLAGFLTNYFSLNQALINDNLAGAKQVAATFSETTKNFDVSKLTGEQLDLYHLHSSNLKLALGNLGASSNIEQARAELATISKAMYALVKAFHPNNTPLYYQYCPMARDNKGANWISATKELENPYMGQMMLACGRTQETIN